MKWLLVLALALIPRLSFGETRIVSPTIEIQDDKVKQGRVIAINYGANLTATVTGGTATVTGNAGGGGSDNSGSHVATMTYTIPAPFGLSASTIYVTDLSSFTGLVHHSSNVVILSTANYDVALQVGSGGRKPTSPNVSLSVQKANGASRIVVIDPTTAGETVLENVLGPGRVGTVSATRFTIGTGNNSHIYITSGPSGASNAAVYIAYQSPALGIGDYQGNFHLRRPGSMLELVGGSLTIKADTGGSGSVGIGLRVGTTNFYIHPRGGVSIGTSSFASSQLDVINGSITVRETDAGIRVASLVNCNTIDTDAEGNFVCGVDEVGGGGGGGGSGHWTYLDGANVVFVDTVNYSADFRRVTVGSSATIRLNPGTTYWLQNAENVIRSTAIWVGAGSLHESTTTLSGSTSTLKVRLDQVALDTGTLRDQFYAYSSTTSVDIDGLYESARSTYVALTSTSIALGASTTTLYGFISSTASNLAAPGVINTPGNPVDWTKLINVPAGFADGTDDGGAGGGGDNFGSHRPTATIDMDGYSISNSSQVAIGTPTPVALLHVTTSPPMTGVPHVIFSTGTEPLFRADGSSLTMNYSRVYFTSGQVINDGYLLFGPNGTAALPILSWFGDRDTGIFRNTANELAFAGGGTNRTMFFSGIILSFGSSFVRIQNRDDTSYSFTNSNTSGLGRRVGSNNIIFLTANGQNTFEMTNSSSGFYAPVWVGSITANVHVTSTGGFSGSGEGLSQTLSLYEEGVFVARVSSINCVGAGATCSAAGDVGTIDVSASGGGGTPIIVQDETVPLSTASVINCAGGGITCTNSGSTITLTVNTSGGGAGGSIFISTGGTTPPVAISTLVIVSPWIKLISFANQNGSSATLVIGNSTKTRVEHFIPVSALKGTEHDPMGDPSRLAATTATANTKMNFDYLTANPSTRSYAFFEFAFSSASDSPFAWDGSTVSAKFHWTASSGTAGTQIQWCIGARAFTGGESMDAAWTSSACVNQSFMGAFKLHQTTETVSYTIAGNPFPGDIIQFRVLNNAPNGAYTFTTVPYLRGVTLVWNKPKYYLDP